MADWQRGWVETLGELQESSEQPEVAAAIVVQKHLPVSRIQDRDRPLSR